MRLALVLAALADLSASSLAGAVPGAPPEVSEPLLELRAPLVRQLPAAAGG